MRSVLIIGLGRFGNHLAAKFAELGNDVMVVDNNEDNIRAVMHSTCSAKIADCTKEEALRSLGVGNFDICFVCSKASTAIHAKFLARNGADEVVYPERDRAEKLAVQYSVSNIFDFIELSDDTGIYEIPIISSWSGHSIIQLNIRNKYNLNILAIKKGDELITIPTAEYVFDKDDHAIVLGRQRDVEKILKNIG